MSKNRIAEIIELANGINARMDGEGSGDNAGADQTGDNKGDDGYPADLGDEGKRAIDRMKAERNQSRTDYNTLKAEYDAYKSANPAKTPERNAGQDENKQTETKSPDQIRDEVMQQVSAESNKRLLRSEVKRLAENRLSDASDALRYLDVSDLTPDANGDFDQAAITSKLDKLLEGRPYLAFQKPQFQGGADGGNRGDSAAKGQLSRDDLKTMSPQDITKAREEGRLADVLSGKK